MEKKEEQKTVHIFDVDLTVIRKTSAWYFLKLAIKEKMIKFSQVKSLPKEWIKYKLARPDTNFIENTVKKLAGLEKKEIEAIADVCFTQYVKKNIYKDAEILIKNTLKKGEKVIFATSSCDFIIKPLEKYFGIENSLASKLEYIDEKTTGNMEGYSFFAGGKRDAAEIWMKENNINPKDVFFYSDSYTDIPLLEYCGHPVAVNPDRILLRHAKKHGYTILRFKEVLKN